MGKVMTVMKIYPVEGADMTKLLDTVYAVKGCNSAKIEEFVFGAKILKASFICEDKEPVDFEEIVKKLEGVNEVQVDEVGLIS